MQVENFEMPFLQGGHTPKQIIFASEHRNKRLEEFLATHDAFEAQGYEIFHILLKNAIQETLTEKEDIRDWLIDARKEPEEQNPQYLFENVVFRKFINFASYAVEYFSPEEMEIWERVKNAG